VAWPVVFEGTGEGSDDNQADTHAYKMETVLNKGKADWTERERILTASTKNYQRPPTNLVNDQDSREGCNEHGDADDS
jgi:hypothetical protein